MIRSTWDKLVQDMREYRRRVRIADKRDPAKILRASWEGFADFAGETGPDLSRLLADYRAFLDAGGKIGDPADADASAAPASASASAASAGSVGWDTKKVECCEELSRLANFVRAELATSEYWGGNLSLKSSFYQKQNFDGYAMRDKTETELNGQAAIKVLFADAGCENPFG